ncbi:MAG: CopD family protein [Gemmatimonadota bacterium]|nr:CopD family protein [Gemmatimonadota bacterium]MDE3172985.1 CopD family protein [Gemmatimonadota bacterium]
MPLLYFVNVTIHVLAALFWLGGMFFLAVVGAPALRAVEPPALRQQLFQELGVRFRTAGWWAIGILVVTGVINLHYRHWLQWNGLLDNPSFWRTAQGHSLAIKLGCVTAMIVVSFVHDFITGPAAGRARPGSPEAAALRRRAALLARLNAIFGLILVIAAVRLARGA